MVNFWLHAWPQTPGRKYNQVMMITLKIMMTMVMMIIGNTTKEGTRVVFYKGKTVIMVLQASPLNSKYGPLSW